MSRDLWNELRPMRQGLMKALDAVGRVFKTQDFHFVCHNLSLYTLHDRAVKEARNLLDRLQGQEVTHASKLLTSYVQLTHRILPHET